MPGCRTISSFIAKHNMRSTIAHDRSTIFAISGDCHRAIGASHKKRLTSRYFTNIIQIVQRNKLSYFGYPLGAHLTLNPLEKAYDYPQYRCRTIW